MQQSRQIEPLENQINIWETELESTGYVKDLAPLLQTLRTLNSESESISLSRILTIASESRVNRKGYDSLVTDWLEKAIKSDPSNLKARNLLADNLWKKKRQLFDALEFPPLRETDNRALKVKTVQNYIHTAQNFLQLGEEDLDYLRNITVIPETATDFKLKRLTQLLEEALEETGALLKATELYEESVTGVFHTAIHYEEIKKRLKVIEDLKILWHAEFSADLPEHTQKNPDPLAELNNMVGLHSVKERVKDFYRFLKFQQKRKQLGLQTKDDQSLNMILTGNPGTGKTSLARLMAKIYFHLDVLPREEVIEADRSQLVGAYVGQTEENVRKVVEQALGGVLFIDEAYSLKREGQTGNDYGQTVIDTLVSLMTGSEFGGKFALIMAGYPEEMRQFLDANPGLRSRFPQSNFIHLPDFSNEELMLIAEQAASDNDFAITEEAKLELKDRLERERVDETFGNARSVRNLVMEAIFKKGARLIEEDDLSAYTLLEKQDFEAVPTLPARSPQLELQSLVGLETVKEEVTSLISFVKMQQLRKENGLPTVPIQLHSVFTGNPGTGKTTVAKIYAEQLKECGMLKRGHLIVSSRADFVAGYVGQTAIKTKKKIREALGGVLFIDEAYSLLGQNSGDFGKEVIDTLVDEMTRHNENLVVILAGYPAEMDMLLESNPGLRSRFKKFFHFPDYSASELLIIIKDRASKFQYTLSEDAQSFLADELDEMQINGNGRFAVNLVDEAIQAQAYRLMENGETDGLTEQALFLEKGDFEKALIKGRKGD